MLKRGHASHSGMGNDANRVSFSNAACRPKINSREPAARNIQIAVVLASYLHTEVGLGKRLSKMCAMKIMHPEKEFLVE